MTSLAEQIDMLSLVGGASSLKKIANTRGGEYAGSCPFCGGSDRFRVWVEDNTWSCRQCVGYDLQPQDAITYVQRRDNCTFLEACQKLGIKTVDSDGRTVARDSKHEYRNLAHYAQTKGVPVEVFTAYHWQDDTYQGRKVIKYPTYGKRNGSVETYHRVRFIDGQKPVYKPIGEDVPLVWYGLKTAIEMAQANELPIVLCNGESSTLIAQHYGVPAFCKTGGENVIPADLLDYLKKHWQGQTLIALDCDKQGRDVAAKIKANQLPDAVVIDLQLTEHGDLADFCQLYEREAMPRLIGLIPQPEPTTSAEAIAYVRQVAAKQLVTHGRILTMPYKILHDLGGLCRYLPPKKMSLFFGMSGHGKTSFVEPMMEYWAQRGNNGIFDGREFSPAEYEFRRIQRYSGQVYEREDGTSYTLTPASYTDFMAHQKHLQEIEEETPAFLRDGKPLTQAQNDTVQWVDKMVGQWVGCIQYAPHKTYLDDLEPNGDAPVTLEQAATDSRFGLLTWAKMYIETHRAQGKHVDYMIFDYMQLYSLRNERGQLGAMQQALYMIKDFAVKMSIHAIVLSQVNKSADSKQRGMNKPLTVADMNYINDAPANLTISLNVAYVESAELDWQGDAQMVKRQLPNGKFAGMVNVLKNSMERTGMVLQQVDFAHYRWLDAGYKVETLSTLDEPEED